MAKAAERVQLQLPLGGMLHDPEALKRQFERAAGRPVFLTITDNSSSVFYMKAAGGGYSLRLHRIFLEAGEEVLGELAEYVRGRRAKTPLFWDFVRKKGDCLKQKPPRRVTLRSGGRYHDLERIYRALNREYFGDRLECGITWSAYRGKRSAKNRTLGSYSSLTGTIRIHPSLDRKSVPRFFVEYIVYHEMLHALLGMEEKNGRRAIHSREFKQRERLFRHFQKALAWEKKHLP